MTVSLGDETVGAGQDTIEAIEAVIGSDGDDTIRGVGAANLLSGMRGDDELNRAHLSPGGVQHRRPVRHHHPSRYRAGTVGTVVRRQRQVSP